MPDLFFNIILKEKIMKISKEDIFSSFYLSFVLIIIVTISFSAGFYQKEILEKIDNAVRYFVTAFLF
jgi:hypothetical protein